MQMFVHTLGNVSAMQLRRRLPSAKHWRATNYLNSVVSRYGPTRNRLERLQIESDDLCAADQKTCRPAANHVVQHSLGHTHRGRLGRSNESRMDAEHLSFCLIIYTPHRATTASTKKFIKHVNINNDIRSVAPCRSGP